MERRVVKVNSAARQTQSRVAAGEAAQAEGHSCGTGVLTLFKVKGVCQVT